MPDCPPKHPMVGLYAQNVQLTRNIKRLLDKIFLNVGPGEILELRGPNGSGKTTLLRVLAGLSRPDAGTLVRNGAMHYCGHDDAVKDLFSVHDQLRFWARIYGADSSDITQALTQTDMEALADLPGRWLSAGQKRRLALARLCLAPRPIWLLDEPFSGLDQQSRLCLNALAQAHCQQGGLIVAAAHGEGFPKAVHFDIQAPPSPRPISSPPITHPDPDTQPAPALMRSFIALVSREIRLAWAGSAGSLAPPSFFAGCAALVPLALGPDPGSLRLVAPGLLMIALALSSLLPLERLFRDDLEDATLDVLACSGISMDGMAIATLIGHWLGTGLPLALLSPLIWLGSQGQASAMGLVLCVSLMASLAMFSLGAAAAALSAGPRHGGLLTAILALPLYWPVMIFASSAMYSAQAGESATNALMLCLACTLFAIAIAPFAISACLRANLDR